MYPSLDGAGIMYMQVPLRESICHMVSGSVAVGRAQGFNTSAATLPPT